MPNPRELGGSFREAGPVTLVALIENAAGTADILQADLTTWALHVFDLDDPDNPDTVKWTLTAQSNTIGWQATRTTGSYARQCPKGFSFLYTIGHDQDDSQGVPVAFDAVTIGARRLRFELEVFDPLGDKEVDGAIAAVWLLKVASRTTGSSA